MSPNTWATGFWAILVIRTLMKTTPSERSGPGLTGQGAMWLAIALAMLGPLAVVAFFPLHDLKGAEWAKSLHEIVRLRRFWILVVVSISINICWHFLINWVPTYLKRERLLLPSTAGYLTAATFLAADLGNLGGGLLSRWLAASGMKVVRAG